MLQRQLDRQRQVRTPRTERDIPLQAWDARDVLTFRDAEDELRRRGRDEWEANMRRFFEEVSRLNLNAIIINNNA